VPEDRWRLLYNGLDLRHFQPDSQLRATFRQDHGLQELIAVGAACAMRPRKQLEHLVKAAADLNDPRVRVVIAGGPVPGDESYVERLLAHARQELGDRFLHVGYLTDLRGFYNGLDVFLNTSREEACSISIIESLACGCPVLGYASKSVDDQILPLGGQIVPQDDVNALTEELCNWVADPAQLAERRAGARQQAEDQFDIRKLADQLWHDYQQLLEEPSVRRHSD
jgi:glycosyltransferase involved in cell wall biosynthesis